MLFWSAVVGLVLGLALALAVAWRFKRQRDRMTTLANQLSERLTSYRQVAVLTTDIKEGTAQAKLAAVIASREALYNEKLDAERRFHASEQNSHRVQEICFREIERLVKSARQKGVTLEPSGHIAHAMSEYQKETGAEEALGPWAVPSG